MAQTQNTQVIQSTQVSTTSENVSSQTVTAQFSNWNSYLSDVRKRYWDEKSGTWYWKIEDVTDADTPNINQLDISISPNERVEIRVSAISEVGWPDSLLESIWSNVLTVDFPDDINDVLNENDFILQEATQDQSVVQMENTLNTKGVYKHIEDSFYINNTYYGHMDKDIAVSFKDDMNNTLNLFEYLSTLTDRIKSLEEIINKVKGELHIYLYKGDTLIKEVLNNTTTQIKIECEDYMLPITGQTRLYLNSLYIIDDYYVSLSNVAQNGDLGLLSNRSFTGGTAFSQDLLNQPLLIDYNDDFYTQQNNQFIWFMDTDQQTNIYTGITYAQHVVFGLNTPKFNLGGSGTTTMNNIYAPWTNINSQNGYYWTGAGTNLLATVHPYFSDITNIVEAGQDKIKKISPNSNFIIGVKIYFKPNGSLYNGSQFNISGDQHYQKQRKVKVYFETDDGKTYQFTLSFNLSNYRLYFRVIPNATNQQNTNNQTPSPL